MKKLYFTVQTDTYPNGRFSGLKLIKLYQIIFNQPKLMGSVKILEDVNGNTALPVELEIQMWLENNGYEDEMFKFIKL